MWASSFWMTDDSISKSAVPFTCVQNVWRECSITGVSLSAELGLCQQMRYVVVSAVYSHRMT
ncbi:hypothetical protein M758_UG189600 [Ceratodon purpureus]|nr:hypothetical protein M758_UG189600 [Ceratodon purpureus]